MSDDKKRDTSRDIAIAHECPIANERPSGSDNAIAASRRVESDKQPKAVRDTLPPPKPKK